MGCVLEPGTVLAGKYRVDRVLGRGGMGTVIAATHLQLETPFAIKFIKPELAKRPGLIDRFMREAKASAQLRGEHVVRVFDVSTADGIPYLVMELLEGTDLAKVISKEGMLLAQRACNYVLQTCAGVAVAHAAGIVHRDVKPGNLFVTPGAGGVELVKVLDFGLAKVSIGDDELAVNRGKNLVGSPAYMAPEQIRTPHEVDTRTDIWALGVVLYELCTGKHPFVGKNLVELTEKIELAPTPPLPGMPPGLEAIVQRCLAKEPNRRYQNVGELAKAVAPLAATATRTLPSVISHVLDTGRVTPQMIADAQQPPGQPTVVERPIAADDSPSEANTIATTLQAASGVIQTRPWRPPRMLWLAGGMAAGLAAVIATYLAVHRSAPRSEEPVARPAAAVTPAPAPVAAQPAVAPPAPPAPVDAAPAITEDTTPTAPKKPAKPAHPTKRTNHDLLKSRL